jgi:DNA-binding NtrC family response regulator
MPSGQSPSRFVLVLNGMKDIVELFRIYLEQDGWSVISATVDEAKRGELDLQALVAAHDPAVVVFDVPPPYDVNWRYLDALRTSGAFVGRAVVVTTTNERRLREFVDTDERLIEVFGKPFDMTEVVKAVRRAVDGGQPAGDRP